MGILERLVNEGAVTIGMVVTSQSNVLSICGIDALPIFYRSGAQTKLRAVVNKWKFQDAVMGERHITFNITSETPISWGVGDYCIFRGETYTLNYVPSVTQKARTGETQDAYTYESVKFESPQEELTRCMMLDITPTTGEYIASLGTNYTGSSRFPLYCGETMIDANGHITSDASQAVKTLTPVCALAAKMQANLDRMYGDRAWIILVDTESTYTNPSGVTELVTHTEDKLMTFDNMTVSAALAEVHNTFDLDYCVMGRRIEIGFPQANLTGDAVADRFFFGYGKGYPTHDSMNTGLFQIKKSSNSQQKIVTRLRVLGSTKNMPYRYYNKKYADGSPDLSQTLFPTNLQLPDTFIQEGSRSDVAGTNSKWGHNKQRDPLLRAVQGDTNDAYIDKNDDAEHCAEGIREDSVRFDGSNSDLPEIYPTIDGAIFSELRGALVEDQDGKTGGNGNTPSSAFYPYANAERIDSLLAVGYLDNGTLVDDANVGDGILPDSDASSYGIVRDAVLDSRTLSYNSSNYGDWSLSDGIFKGEERTLFTINGVSPGKYVMAPTIGAVMYGYSISTSEDMLTANIGYIIKIKQTSLTSGVTSELAVYPSDYRTVKQRSGTVEVELPRLPDVERQGGAKVPEIKVTDTSNIVVTFTPTMKIGVMPSASSTFTFTYKVNNSIKENAVTLKSQYTWSSDDDSSNSKPFHVFIKDMGFDITACWTDDTPVVAMKSGRCVGREFEIGKSVEKVTYNGKKGYMLTLNRASDDSIHTYYPSETNPIAAGDFFVLLNISMPDIYVKMAEVRLLRAATNYLSDNCETQFTYQPYIDDIYLRRNYDNMLAAGTPGKSILWRLYAGRKFTFLGVPASESDPLPQAEITIASLSIQMGEGMTPKTEITLNDDVQQSTLQKLTTTVNRIYNGSIFASGSSSGGSGIDASSLYSLLQSEGGRMFLSKRSDDETPYTLTMGGANVLGDLDVAGDTALSGNTILGSVPFTPDSTGYGYIENQGGHFLQVENLKVLGKMEAKEVEIQEVNYVGGSIVLTPANGFTAVRVVPVDENFDETDSDEDREGYKLYYNRKKDDGTIVRNTWKVGDLAYCERWDLREGVQTNFETHRWWRKVLAVSTDYVSQNELDTDTELGWIVVSDVQRQIESLSNSVPMVDDKVVMLGHDEDDGNEDDDADRQTAIILSASQRYAPYIRMYKGVPVKSQTSPWYRLPEPFIDLNGYDTKITADTINISSSGETKNVGDVLGQLGGKLDHKFEIWQVDWTVEADAAPTLNDEPASSWTTAELRAEHEGDFIILSDGRCFQFSAIGQTYEWKEVSDKYLIDYVTMIGSKSSVFNGSGMRESQIPTNYKANDIWVNCQYHNNSIDYRDEILVAVRDYSGAADISDWTTTNNYKADVASYKEAIENIVAKYDIQPDGKHETYFVDYDTTQYSSIAALLSAIEDDWIAHKQPDQDAEDVKKEHIGDLCYVKPYTGYPDGRLYEYTRRLVEADGYEYYEYGWEPSNDAITKNMLMNIHDTQAAVDGKVNTFFYPSPSTITDYHQGDLLVIANNNGNPCNFNYMEGGEEKTKSYKDETLVCISDYNGAFSITDWKPIGDYPTRDDVNAMMEQYKVNAGLIEEDDFADLYAHATLNGVEVAGGHVTPKVTWVDDGDGTGHWESEVKIQADNILLSGTTNFFLRAQQQELLGALANKDIITYNDLAGALKTEIDGKATPSQIAGALQDGTIIAGGYINTTLLDVSDIKAKLIEVEHILGTDAVFSGTLQAQSGYFEGYLRTAFETDATETYTEVDGVRVYSLSGNHCNLIVQRGRKYLLPCDSTQVGKRIILVDPAATSDTDLSVVKVATSNGTGIIGYLGEDIITDSSANPSELYFRNGLMEFVCASYNGTRRWILTSNHTAWNKSSNSLFQSIDRKPVLLYYGLVNIANLVNSGTTPSTLGITTYYNKPNVSVRGRRRGQGDSVLHLDFSDISVTWNQNLIITPVGYGVDSSNRPTYATVKEIALGQNEEMALAEITASNYAGLTDGQYYVKIEYLG